jgi:hypothetical protein
MQTERRRYTELTDDGIDGIVDSDSGAAVSSDNELAWASAVAASYKSIRSALGRIAWIEQELARQRDGCWPEGVL